MIRFLATLCKQSFYCYFCVKTPGFADRRSLHAKNNSKNFIYRALSYFFFAIFLFQSYVEAAPVLVGSEQLFNTQILKGQRVGLITNQTAINSRMESTLDLLKKNAKSQGYEIAALFAPEHGINGAGYAWEKIEDARDADGIPILSLHGKTRRPTEEMLKGITLLVYDIQDIGSRSYTYITTLFYAMEEAAKKRIRVVVLDRPNPINGLTIDGPLLEDKCRSYVGYINVPYCHGMTIGELAQYFNGEYRIGCDLTVVPMKGWKRNMTFKETGLPWIPTSPYIPESDTPFFYPTTGILGELQIVNIGIGYTLPFKLVGAPWIDAQRFAAALNAQKFPGVTFQPFYFRPFYGKFVQEDCQGVLIIVTNPLTYKPVSTQYLIIGMLKSLYPKQFKEALADSASRKDMFCKINGTEEAFRIVAEDKNIVWKLCNLHLKQREAFLEKRKKYLIAAYSLP